MHTNKNLVLITQHIFLTLTNVANRIFFTNYHFMTHCKYHTIHKRSNSKGVIKLMHKYNNRKQ